MALEIFNHSKPLRLIELRYFLSKKMAIDVTFLELILQNWSAEREKNLTNCLDDPKDRNIKNNHLGGRWAVWFDRKSSPTRRWDLIYS